MKTTIDIPEPLYKKAKIRAVEQGTSLRALVLESLEHELGKATGVAESKGSYWANRKLVPGFKKLIESGSLGEGTDSTHIISEDRTSRDESLR